MHYRDFMIQLTKIIFYAMFSDIIQISCPGKTIWIWRRYLSLKDWINRLLYLNCLSKGHNSNKKAIRYGPTARTNPLTLHVMLAPVGVRKLICCSMYQQLAYVIVIVVFGWWLTVHCDETFLLAYAFTTKITSSLTPYIFLVYSRKYDVFYDI